jgi:hypothetical protein
MWFIPPAINTGENRDPTLCDPTQPDSPEVVALARAVNQFYAIEEVPVYEHARAFSSPGVPWNYGWHYPLIDWPASYQPWPYPTQAPPLSLVTPAFNEQLRNARQPVPTLAATGVSGPLRAPSINEGYS